MSDDELEYRMRENEAVHRRWAATNAVLIAERERRKSFRTVTRRSDRVGHWHTYRPDGSEIG